MTLSKKLEAFDVYDLIFCTYMDNKKNLATCRPVYCQLNPNWFVVISQQRSEDSYLMAFGILGRSPLQLNYRLYRHFIYDNKKTMFEVIALEITDYINRIVDEWDKE